MEHISRTTLSNAQRLHKKEVRHMLAAAREGLKEGFNGENEKTQTLLNYLVFSNQKTPVNVLLAVLKLESELTEAGQNGADKLNTQLQGFSQLAAERAEQQGSAYACGGDFAAVGPGTCGGCAHQAAHGSTDIEDIAQGPKLASDTALDKAARQLNRKDDEDFAAAVRKFEETLAKPSKKGGCAIC